MVAPLLSAKLNYAVFLTLQINRQAKLISYLNFCSNTTKLTIPKAQAFTIDAIKPDHLSPSRKVFWRVRDGLA